MKEPDSRISELDALIAKAERAVRSLDCRDWGIRFKTPDEFGDALVDALKRIHAGAPSGLHDLRSIFGPTGTWDDEIGVQGMDLANQVLLLTNELKKEMPTPNSSVRGIPRR